MVAGVAAATLIACGPSAGLSSGSDGTQSSRPEPEGTLAGPPPQDVRPTEAALEEPRVTHLSTSVTVHSLEDSGTRNTAVRVTVCLPQVVPRQRTSVPLEQFEEFKLETTAGEILEPLSGGKAPRLSIQGLSPGQCATGYVTFLVPDGDSPRAVLFGPPASRIRWALN